MKFIKLTKNKPERWENIDKVKWEGLPQKEEITEKLTLASDNFIPSTQINILKGINNKSKQSLCTEKNGKIIPSTHDNLIKIVGSIDLLRVSYNKLKKNKGSMTPGTAGLTADEISEEMIEELSQEITQGKFQWNPVKRIYIRKPGKPGMRPLGLPDFKDKMLQNNIKLILEAIYEPEFEHTGTNAGFRPNKGCNTSIAQIKRNGNGSNFALEGDIKGAYDNVKHNILIQILRKRIKDEKFITLLYKGLQSGLMEDYTYYDTFLGVPQGGIASPILFNIYMNEFDKFVMTDLKEYTNNINLTITKKTLVTTEYYKLDSQMDRLIKKIKQLKNLNPINILEKGTYISSNYLINSFKILKEEIYNTNFKKEADELFENTLSHSEQLTFTEYNNNRNSKFRETKNLHEYNQTEQKAIIKGNKYNNIKGIIRRKIKKYITENNMLTELYDVYLDILETKLQLVRNQKLDTPYIDLNNKHAKFTYNRYADDWIILISGPQSLAIEYKEIIKEWLKTNLGLELALDKTLITNLFTHKAHFLGFEIFYQTNYKIVSRKMTNTLNTDSTIPQRYRGLLQIMPDKTRLLNKFLWKNYIDDELKPRELGYLTVLEDHEIIEKYNQMMIGIGNYYIIEISRKSALNYWHYNLYYSCIKTLACKHRNTVGKIMADGYKDISNPKVNPNQDNQMATNLRIIRSYTKQDKPTKHVILLNYSEFMMKILKLRDKYRNKEPYYVPPIDFNTLQKANWRTKFKLATCCAVCGNTEKLESHHIKPIHHGHGKFTGYKGFDKLVASLGRKQITVCRICHVKITKGLYDGISLSDFFDIRLVAPEGNIKLNKHFNYNTEEPKEKAILPWKIEKIEIDEYKKTYFNPALQQYYKNKTETETEILPLDIQIPD